MNRSLSIQSGLTVYRFPILVFLVYRGLIFIYQAFWQTNFLVTSYSDTLYERVFLSWTAYWDSGHFGEIARLGYAGHPQVVLFPLWPILIKFLTIPMLHRYTAIYILSITLSLAVFILLFELSRRLVGEPKAKIALLIFASYPGALFLHAGYSENLFLVFALLSFLLFEKKRFLLGSSMGALASLTRLAGLSLTAAYLFAKTKLSKRILYGDIVLLGIAAYMLYLGWNYGNPIAFFTEQKGWGKAGSFSALQFPLSPLLKYLGFLLIGWVTPEITPTFIDWLVSVLVLVLLVPIYKRLGKAYASYTATLLIFPLASGTFIGMNRYILPAFPAFLILASYFQSKIILAAFLLLLFGIQLYFITLFTNLVWVA